MNNYFDIRSSNFLNDQHTHIVFVYTNDKRDVPNPKAVTSAKKIIAHYNTTTTKPHVKKLSNIQIFANQNSAILWESLTYAVKKTYNENKLWETVADTAHIVAYAVFSITIVKIHFNIIQDLYSKMGKGMPLYDTKKGRWVQESLHGSIYTGIIFITQSISLTCVTLILVGAATLCILSVITKNSIYLYCKKHQKEKKSAYILTKEIITERLDMANVNLDDINNIIDEDGNPKDPISFNPISKEQLRTPSIFLIGKYVITHNSALEAILRKKISNRKILQIPHPLEDRVMDDSERSIFINNLSKLMCETRVKIITCWEVDNNISEQELTPSKRFSQLATTSVVFNQKKLTRV